MILEPGTFRVSDYRKDMPWHVKAIAAVRWVTQEKRTNVLDIQLYKLLRKLQFDHRPPLCDRPYDTELGDFIPGQNDPDHIFALSAEDHLERTTGRKAGAECTVTTRGSDIGERKRVRDIKASEAVHKALMASKAGDHTSAADILANVKPKRPKKRIPSRPFPSTQRSWR
jgi:hypothetical protein